MSSITRNPPVAQKTKTTTPLKKRNQNQTPTAQPSTSTPNPYASHSPPTYETAQAQATTNTAPHA